MSSTKHLERLHGRALDPGRKVAGSLDAARTGFREDPAGTLALAIHCSDRAKALGDRPLRARALALEGHVALHRGDIRSGLALAIEAERVLGAFVDGHHVAQSEVAALRAQVS